MIYAEPSEFTSQQKTRVSGSEQPFAIQEKIKGMLSAFCTKRNDPTRMSKVERRESGLSETAIDWHNALHGPLVK